MWIPFLGPSSHICLVHKQLWTTGLVRIISWKTKDNLVWSKPCSMYHEAVMPQHQLLEPARLLPLHQITCWGRLGYPLSASFQTWNYVVRLNIWRALSDHRNWWQANWSLVIQEAQKERWGQQDGELEPQWRQHISKSSAAVLQHGIRNKCKSENNVLFSSQSDLQHHLQCLRCPIWSLVCILMKSSLTLSYLKMTRQKLSSNCDFQTVSGSWELRK